MIEIILTILFIAFVFLPIYVFWDSKNSPVKYVGRVEKAKKCKWNENKTCPYSMNVYQNKYKLYTRVRLAEESLNCCKIKQPTTHRVVEVED